MLHYGDSSVPENLEICKTLPWQRKRIIKSCKKICYINIVSDEVACEQHDPIIIFFIVVTLQKYKNIKCNLKKIYF